jgi:hypothetical protein
VSVSAVLRRIGRWIGVVTIFSIVGPLAFAMLILLIVAGFGVPLLQIALGLVDLGALGTVISVALWLLVMASLLASLLASFPPSVVAGCVFASLAVFAGMNSVWMAWLAMAIALVGVIVLGILFVPDESSAVILPGARSAGETLALFAVLAALATLPTLLCWWLAKPLHRASIAA